MNYQPYDLDRKAQTLVLDYRDKDVLNESHKMRATVAYGLERFWGEHLRLLVQARKSNGSDDLKTLNKAHYWRDTWHALAKIMQEAGITIPNDEVDPHLDSSTGQIRRMAQKLWGDEDESFSESEKKSVLAEEDRKIVLTVLAQLCDSLVWWAQRYKRVGDRDAANTNED